MPGRGDLVSKRDKGIPSQSFPRLWGRADCGKGMHRGCPGNNKYTSWAAEVHSCQRILEGKTGQKTPGSVLQVGSMAHLSASKGCK